MTLFNDDSSTNGLGTIAGWQDLEHHFKGLITGRSIGKEMIKKRS